MNQYLKYFIYFLLGVIIYYFLFNSTNAKSQKVIEGFVTSYDKLNMPGFYLDDDNNLTTDPETTDPTDPNTKTPNLQIPFQYISHDITLDSSYAVDAGLDRLNAETKNLAEQSAAPGAQTAAIQLTKITEIPSEFTEFTELERPAPVVYTNTNTDIYVMISLINRQDQRDGDYYNPCNQVSVDILNNSNGFFDTMNTDIDSELKIYSKESTSIGSLLEFSIKINSRDVEFNIDLNIDVISKSASTREFLEEIKEVAPDFASNSIAVSEWAKVVGNTTDKNFIDEFPVPVVGNPIPTTHSQVLLMFPTKKYKIDNEEILLLKDQLPGFVRTTNPGFEINMSNYDAHIIRTNISATKLSSLILKPIYVDPNNIKFNYYQKIINLLDIENAICIGLVEACQKRSEFISTEPDVVTLTNEAINTLFNAIKSSNETTLTFSENRGCENFTCGHEPGYNVPHSNWKSMTNPQTNEFHTCFNTADSDLSLHDGNMCNTPLCCKNDLCDVSDTICNRGRGSGSLSLRNKHCDSSAGINSCIDPEHCCSEPPTGQNTTVYNNIINFMHAHDEQGGQITGKDILYFIYDNLIDIESTSNLKEAITKYTSSDGVTKPYDKFDAIEGFFRDASFTAGDPDTGLAAAFSGNSETGLPSNDWFDGDTNLKLKTTSTDSITDVQQSIVAYTKIIIDTELEIPEASGPVNEKELKAFIVLINEPNPKTKWTPLDYILEADTHHVRGASLVGSGRPGSGGGYGKTISRSLFGLFLPNI